MSHVFDANGNRINPATEETMDDIKVLLRSGMSSGLPMYGVDAAGADAYTAVVEASRPCYNMKIDLAAGNNAIISLNSGGNDHLFIMGNSTNLFNNLTIEAGSTIQGKNAVAGSNYTNLRISIW